MEQHGYRWDVFISHASEDKVIALTLKEWLECFYGLRVWLDQSELKIGDSLRRSIEYGLAQSRFGIVILSPAFFSKHWPKEELAGLAVKGVDGIRVILPIWYEVTLSQVREQSPILADKLAIVWDGTPQKILHPLVRAMGFLPDGSCLAGTWRGQTGRMKLRQVGTGYSRDTYYDGEYDWGGREWAGHLHGVLYFRSRILVFHWYWNAGPERGIAFLELNEDERELAGCWKTLDEKTGVSERNKYPDNLSALALQEIRLQ